MLELSCVLNHGQSGMLVVQQWKMVEVCLCMWSMVEPCLICADNPTHLAPKKHKKTQSSGKVQSKHTHKPTLVKQHNDSYNFWRNIFPQTHHKKSLLDQTTEPDPKVIPIKWTTSILKKAHKKLGRLGDFCLIFNDLFFLGFFKIKMLA